MKVHDTIRREKYGMNLEAIALLDFSNKVIHNITGADAGDQALDDIITTINIQKASNNSGKTRWVDFLNVNLDILALIVLKNKRKVY